MLNFESKRKQGLYTNNRDKICKIVITKINVNLYKNDILKPKCLNKNNNNNNNNNNKQQQLQQQQQQKQQQ